MRALLICLMLTILLWAGSLVWFMQSMPQQALPATTHADALIVLTGGADRVEHGLEMLAEGAAPVLFITGVGSHVTLLQMLDAHASPSARRRIMQNRPEIIFDYRADSTQTNAEQTQSFAKTRTLYKVRLVTAHYHMPRSMLEFRKALPGITVIADPVFPQGFRRSQWWQHENTRRLIFSEYYKYYGAMLGIYSSDALTP